jgi:osmotically-inducible protein OsmY
MRNVTSTSSRQNKSNRGKGPRSQKPSGTRILERINERLCDNPYVDASDIEVSVDNGVVILNGTVNSRDEKRLTEEIAEEIPGVEDVENRIHVTLKGI